MKLVGIYLVLICALAATTAEPRAQRQIGLRQQSGAAIQSINHPYLFLSIPRGRGEGDLIQGFRVVEEEEDDDDDDDDVAGNNALMMDDDDNDDSGSDDDDNDGFGGIHQRAHLINAVSLSDDPDDSENNLHDDDDEMNDDADDSSSDKPEIEADDDTEDNDDEKDVRVVDAITNNVPLVMQLAAGNIRSPGNNLQALLQGAKDTNMMVRKDQAGAIMVPDGIIEIEGQSVFDEKTGRTALLVPRSALEAIPDGSVVAVMEGRSASGNALDDEEERANRVIVRRRRKGAKRNVRRRGGVRRRPVRRRGGNNVRRRRRGGNRRRVNKRKNVRVIRTGGNRRRGVRQGNRRRRPVRVQG